MSDAKDRLKKLLDGDLEASDIAEDASLVSLADRLYGIKIANVKPVKARDLEINLNPNTRWTATIRPNFELDG